MKYHYPAPHEVGIRIPMHLIEERFCQGFKHALKGLPVTCSEHLRESFRLGFRAGKLYLRDLRREMGIVEFPVTGKFTIKAA